MKPIAIVQARLGSSRLPGKILYPIGDRPAIVHTLQRVRSVLPTLLALPFSKAHRKVRAICRNHCDGVLMVGGDENDVLGRYAKIVKLLLEEWDPIVRITGDCPFIEPQVIKDSLEAYDPEVGYFYSHDKWRLPKGYDVEVIARSALLETNELKLTAHEREHVTPYFRKLLAMPDPAYTGRRVLDTKEDWEDLCAWWKSECAKNTGTVETDTAPGSPPSPMPS